VRILWCYCSGAKKRDYQPVGILFKSVNICHRRLRNRRLRQEVEDANEDAVAAFASFVGASLLAEQEATSHRGGIGGDGDEQQGLFATATTTATAGALAKATATTTGEGTAASDSATEDLTLPPALTPVPVPSAATTTKTAVEVVSSPAAVRVCLIYGRI
jgi:hypothetical protein